MHIYTPIIHIPLGELSSVIPNISKRLRIYATHNVSMVEIKLTDLAGDVQHICDLLSFFDKIREDGIPELSHSCFDINSEQEIGFYGRALNTLFFNSQIDLFKKWFSSMHYFTHGSIRYRSMLHKMRKTVYVHRLYRNVEKHGMLECISITRDGHRISGDHRTSILYHLGYDTTVVNLVDYMECFSEKESQCIANFIRDYRQKAYLTVDEYAV